MGAAFPEIATALEELPRGVVLDCELVVPTAQGRPDFEALRRRMLLQRRRLIGEAAARTPAVLIVFACCKAAEGTCAISRWRIARSGYAATSNRHRVSN